MTRAEHYQEAERHLQSSAEAIDMLNKFLEKHPPNAIEPMSNSIGVMLICSIDALTHATLANCRVRTIDNGE